MAEVAISTASMASLLAIFALLPRYGASLKNVEIRQKAQAIIKEVSTSIEEIQPDDPSPQLHVDNIDQVGSDWPGALVNSPQFLTTDETITGSPNTYTNVENRITNLTYRMSIDLFNPDVLDVDVDDIRNEDLGLDNGADISRVSMTVGWRGQQCGSIHREENVTNTSINFANASRLSAQRTCRGVERWCLCDDPTNCSQMCRCEE